jgi:hypothetical protein
MYEAAWVKAAVGILAVVSLFLWWPTQGSRAAIGAGTTSQTWEYRRVFIFRPSPTLTRMSPNQDEQRALVSTQVSDFYSTRLNELAAIGWELHLVTEQTDGIATYWKRAPEPARYR